jgi:hypothetical protein
LTIVIISSCKEEKEKTIEADLYFRLFDIERFYDSPDSSLIKIENLVHEINNDTLDNKRKEEYKHFKFMVANNLLRKQFIWIRMDDGEKKILFLDSLDYNKLKKYNWSDLTKGKRRIRIRTIVREFEYPYYFEDTETAYDCVKMLTIDKISGETHWEK